MKTVLSSSSRASLFSLAAFVGLAGLVTSLMAGFAPFDLGRGRAPEPLIVQVEEEGDDNQEEEIGAITFSFAVTESAFAPAEQATAIDVATVLRAIAEVESRNNPASVGRLGERGLYQFRRATWRQHTRENFSRAHHPAISTTVAHRHYDWLARELRRHGLEGNVYEVALAWNAGLSRVVNGRASSRSHHYAQRVVNLTTH